MIRRPPRSTLFPLHDALPILDGIIVDTLYVKTMHGPEHRQTFLDIAKAGVGHPFEYSGIWQHMVDMSTMCCQDRKSTRLNSSHLVISYAVFCLKKKTLYFDHS